MTKNEFNTKLEQIKNKPHAIENIEIIKNLIGTDFKYLGNEFTIQKRFNSTIVVIDVNLKTGEILNYKIKVNESSYENKIVFESYVYLSVEAHLDFFLVLFFDYLERFYAQKDESSFNPYIVNSEKIIKHFFDNNEEKRNEKRTELEFQKIQQLISENKNVVVYIDNNEYLDPPLKYSEDEFYGTCKSEFKLFRLDSAYKGKLFEHYKMSIGVNMLIFKEDATVKGIYQQEFTYKKLREYVHTIYC